MKLDLNQIYFNSIKVRLKPKPVILKYEIEEFQFHKGTIKTYIFKLCLINHNISIP